MKFRLALILICNLWTLQTFAGEKPALRLTGNPTIDFFGDGEKLTAGKSFLNDSISPTQMYVEGKSKKSPWIAGLLSLAVPGAGEVYTENYFKGAVFFAVEAASWIGAYTYDKKGDRQTDMFQDYANAHWSAARYARWLQYQFALDPVTYPLFNDPSVTDGPPPFACVNWNELERAKAHIDSTTTNAGFSHSLPFWGQQQYYELIGKYYQFSKGWDSQELSGGGFDPSDYHNGNPQFDQYREMFNQADKYYDVAGTFVSVAVVNHILSAIDAAWSATRYNSDLHAEVRMNMIPTRRGFTTMTEAKVSLTF